MRQIKYSVSSIWRTVAVAAVGFQIEQALGMTMLGPSTKVTRNSGNSFAQTSAQTVGSPLAEGSKAEPVDNDPCHN